jgi:hypothetical protein
MGERSLCTLKSWAPVALGLVVVSAYAYVYCLNTVGNGSWGSFRLADSIGLAAVVIGVIAAGFIFRRATPVTQVK